MSKTNVKQEKKSIQFFNGELYEEQQEALKALLKSDIGLLSAGTGFGKTVVASALISERKTNTLILVQSHALLATGKYAGEGFDYPRIDTLMIAMPFSWKGTLAQYCGRLHRNFSGKEEVRIYDYIDFRMPVFDRMYQNRLKGYKQLGYSLKPSVSTENEKISDSKLYSAEDYKSDFEKDLLSANSKIIMSVPYLSKNSVYDFVLKVSSIVSKGVIIQVYISIPKDESTQKKIEPYIEILDDAGIKVFVKENFTQKVAVIDEQILWYGSVNFLGFTENEECCMRIANTQIASEVEVEVVSYSGDGKC